MRRELKRLRTYLGRVHRDVSRKVDGQPELERHFARLLPLTPAQPTAPRQEQALRTACARGGLHAPEGKAHKKYEFGCKVATTNREGFAVASKAFAGNRYDGHTLAATNQQVVRITGVEPTRYYADRGYHDYDKPERVFISGRRRGLTPTIKRELRRRSAIEAMIGHMKTDGRLGRNYLLGHAGDAVNALLCAAGHNLRLILNRLRAFFALILVMFSAAENRNTLRPPPIHA